MEGNTKEYAKVTGENIENEHICCAISKKQERHPVRASLLLSYIQMFCSAVCSVNMKALPSPSTLSTFISSSRCFMIS